MVLICIGCVVLALTPFRISTPANLVWNVRIIESGRHEMKKCGSVTFNSIFPFRIPATQVAMVLDMGLILIPFASPGTILILPSTFIPDTLSYRCGFCAERLSGPVRFALAVPARLPGRACCPLPRRLPKWDGRHLHRPVQ